jgi:hypothetical protein
MLKTYQMIFEEKIIFFQLLTLTNSIYFFVGDSSLKFENLILAIKNIE